MRILIHIQDWSDARAEKNSSFKVFNVHVNGCHHSSVRYSTLLDFHNELKRNYDITNLEPFPPKKVLMSAQALEERRLGLELYLHSVSQDTVIGTSDHFKEFLLAAQEASSSIVQSSVDLEVYLLNDKKVTLAVKPFLNTDEILELVCEKIELPSDLTYYFSLCLDEQNDDKWTLFRPLQDYECPCVTLTTLCEQAPHRITLRKSFFHSCYVDNLLDDRTAKNLLYVEMVEQIKRGMIQVSADALRDLESVRKSSQKQEYLEKAKALPQFGYRMMDGLSFDHPTKDLKGFVRIGPGVVVTYARRGWDAEPEQTSAYSITRIRCWKVGWKDNGKSPFMAMEYNNGDNKMIWITLIGKQVVNLTLAMNEAVLELLRVMKKGEVRKPSDHPARNSKAKRTLPKFTIIAPTDPSPDSSPHLESNSTTGGAEALPASQPTKVDSHRHDSNSSYDNSPEVSHAQHTRQEKVGTTKARVIGRKHKVSENPTFNTGGDDDL